MIGENGVKQAFTSSQAFLGLGFKFKNMIKLDLTDYTTGQLITTSQAPHPEGSLILDKTTVYLVLGGKKLPFSSSEVFKSFNFSFAHLVPANSFDSTLQIGEQF
ncbi:MAG: hypothetical protein ABI643_03640 [Candidatus Doudnabacteria bacterium]